MNSTTHVDLACTTDDETTQGVFWIAVTATTTSFTINNQPAYSGGSITPTSPENIKDYVVYSGNCNSLTEIACATLDASATATGQLTVSPVVAGQVYLIMASPAAVSLTSDLLRFCITAPVAYTVPNNSCGSAIPLSLNVPVAGTTAGACMSGPLCVGSIENDVWYQWCAPATLTAGTEVFLNVFGGGPGSGPMCIAGPQGLQFTVWNTNTTCPTTASSPHLVCSPTALSSCYSGSNLSFTAIPGQCYYLTIDGYAGSSCAFTVVLTTSVASGGIGATCAACMAPTITGNASVCEGETLVLTANNTQTGTTYSWTGPNNFSATTATISFPNASSALDGVYTVTSTNPLCATPLTNSIAVVVNSMPALPVAQVIAACGPGAVVLSASGSPHSYIWSDNASGLPVLGTDSVFLIPNLPAGTSYTYYVQSVSQGCPPSAAVAVPVTVLASPVVAFLPASAIICPGQIIELTATGANTYQWFPDSTLSSTGGAIVTAVPAVSSTYSVVGIAANGCLDTASFHVQVSVLPTAAFSYTQLFNEFTFTAADSLATFSWNFGDGDTSSTQNPVHTYATSGNFTVTLTVTNADSCSATTTQQVTSIISGLASSVNGAISLYPNPAGNILFVNNKAELQHVKIELFSVTGQKLLETVHRGGTAGIDISQLTPGVYLARLLTDKFALQQKLVISR